MSHFEPYDTQTDGAEYFYPDTETTMLYNSAGRPESVTCAKKTLWPVPCSVHKDVQNVCKTHHSNIETRVCGKQDHLIGRLLCDFVLEFSAKCHL